ncbi:MAG: hypothetical protein CML79_06820 [Rhodobiaceae bacterium]|nr:hypothetical protein [Rhodobiaceae bacterium]
MEDVGINLPLILFTQLHDSGEDIRIKLYGRKGSKEIVVSNAYISVFANDLAKLSTQNPSARPR